MHEEYWNEEVKFPHWQRKFMRLVKKMPTAGKENACRWKKKMHA